MTESLQGILGPLLAVAAVVALAVAAGIGAPSPQMSDAQIGNPNQVTSFYWDAPQEFTGDLAVVLELSTDAETFCRWDVLTLGRVDKGNPLLLWANGRSEQGRVQHTVWNPEVVQAHAAGIADSRLVTVENEHYWTSAGSGSRFGTERWGYSLEITIAGFGLEHWNGGPESSPFVLDLTCDHPVELSLTGSESAIGFTHQTFSDGGVGASTEGLVSQNLNSAVYWQARTEAEFGTPFVRFQFDFSAVDDETGLTRGRLALHDPDGFESWELPSTCPDACYLWATHDGGPGDYAAELELFGAHRANHLFGVLVGSAPVESLDDLV